jgi:hypothetical protein
LYRYKERDISPEQTDRRKGKHKEYWSYKGSFPKSTLNVEIMTLSELMAGGGKSPHFSTTLSDSAHSSTMMMEATGSSTWYHILEDDNLHSHCHEKLKSHREIHTYRNRCTMALGSDSCLSKSLTETHRRGG